MVLSVAIFRISESFNIYDTLDLQNPVAGAWFGGEGILFSRVQMLPNVCVFGFRPSSGYC